MIGSPSYGGVKNGVLEVKGKAVVFFSPTQEEYNVISDKDKSEWGEVLSDFYHYRDKTIPFIESNNIKPIITADMKINIHLAATNHIYTRKKFEHIVGYILTDGIRDPKVVLGVGTDSDIIENVKEYFKLR